VLDVCNGLVKYVSAGHEPPLVRRLDGSIRELQADSGAAIGIDAPVEYRLAQGFLAPGDTLVLYTDGVTEAESADLTQFGRERLAKLLAGEPANEPASLVRRVVESVGAHSADFHAADDVTVLAVCFWPPTIATRHEAERECWRIGVTTSADGIRQAQQWLRTILGAREIAAERVADVELIAEELLTNIVRENDGGRVAVAVECVLDRDVIALVFSDDGKPFDPLARDAPDLSADAAGRAIGGLGIHIVRELADAAHYSYRDGRNVLEIRLRRTTSTQGAPA
jgi:sigma-B regulation protein RsbU (phosphoserine phosphatase)